MSFDFKKIGSVVKDHPFIIGGAAILIFVLFFMRGNSSGGGDGGNLAQAYLAAQSADKASGDQVQIAQIQANAAVALNKQNADSQTAIQSGWATAQVQTAPYTTAQSLGQSLAQYGATLSADTSSSASYSSKSGGFNLGAFMGGGGPGGSIGITSGKSSGSTSSSTTTSAGQLAIADEFGHLIQGFIPGH